MKVKSLVLFGPVIMGLFAACSQQGSDESNLYSDEDFVKGYMIRPRHSDISQHCGGQIGTSYDKQSSALAALAYCIANLPDGSTCAVFPDSCTKIEVWSVPAGMKLPKMQACADDPKPKDTKGLTLSPVGLDLIKAKEGFSSKLYNDIAGHCTIGYGQLVHYGACDGVNAAEKSFVNGISEPDATKLLGDMVMKSENEVKERIGGQMLQYEYDSLVSFAYNLGPNALNSRSIQNIGTNNLFSSTERSSGGIAMTKFSYAGSKGAKKWSEGLNTRRAQEAMMFSGACPKK